MLNQSKLLSAIPMTGRIPKPPTARLREMHRQLSMFRYSQAELVFFQRDIELELESLEK